MTKKQQTTLKLVKTLYELDDKPIELSPSQLDIFNIIFLQEHNRVITIAPTQYGKSLTVALAVLTRAITFGEKFIILAPNQKKADIIMGHVIDHVFDVSEFTQQLELDPTEKLERLKRKRTKDNIGFKNGGGVKTISLDARNSKRNIESAMGFGGNRIVLDESSLIDDVLYATVIRMLGGYEYKDTFLFEIGNPFYRNHFHKTFTEENNYHKVFIDYHKALDEGRFSPEFIEEMRGKPLFSIFYECKFPDEDAIDAGGYRRLITQEQLNNAFVNTDKRTTNIKLGVDIGGGGDKNVYSLRSDDLAWVECENNSNNTMTNVSEVLRLKEQYNIQDKDIFIDDTGIGRGVSDRLRELGHNVNAVVVGAKAKDYTKYKNIKAENAFLFKTWLTNKGKIRRDSRLNELIEIKYKISTDKVIEIESKKDLRARLGKSPDYADSLLLTFTDKPRSRVIAQKPRGF